MADRNGEFSHAREQTRSVMRTRSARIVCNGTTYTIVGPPKFCPGCGKPLSASATFEHWRPLESKHG